MAWTISNVHFTNFDGAYWNVHDTFCLSRFSNEDFLYDDRDTQYVRVYIKPQPVLTWTQPRKTNKTTGHFDFFQLVIEHIWHAKRNKEKEETNEFWRRIKVQSTKRNVSFKDPYSIEWKSRFKIYCVLTILHAVDSKSQASFFGGQTDVRTKRSKNTFASQSIRQFNR